VFVICNLGAFNLVTTLPLASEKWFDWFLENIDPLIQSAAMQFYLLAAGE